MPPWVAGATGDGWGAHNDRAEVAARAVARNMRQGRDTKSGGRAGVLVAQLMAAIDQLRLSSSSLSTKPAVICATSVCQDVQHYLTRRNKVDAESARRALSQVDGHKFLARLLDSDEPCVVEAACRALQSLTFEAADIVKGTMSISGVPQRLAVILGKTPAERSGIGAPSGWLGAQAAASGLLTCLTADAIDSVALLARAGAAPLLAALLVGPDTPDATKIIVSQALVNISAGGLYT
jgi:hypothetical protein